MSDNLTILFLGDIVGRLGRQTVKELLPNLVKQHKIDFVFANVENLAGGRGVTPNTLDEMLAAGVDYFTSGNHIFYQDGFKEVLTEKSYRLLRPANYPTEVPGKGYAVLEKNGRQIVLVNLLGASLSELGLDPFRRMDELLELFQADSITIPSAVILVDLHAEFTSEKRALAFYLDGRVTGVFGTHTHVPTADAQILPKGSAYVTDLGMCGARNSVLGVDPKIIIQKQMYPYPIRFEWVVKGLAIFNSVLVKVNQIGKVRSIERIDCTTE